MTSREKAQRLIDTKSCVCFWCSADGTRCPLYDGCKDYGDVPNGGLNEKGIHACREFLAEGAPVTEFKVGHWYTWVGPKERGPAWSPLMDFMLDGKPHKCIKINEKYNYANFDKDKDNELWAWGSLEHFREVPAPDAVKMTTYKTAIHWVGKQPEIVSSEGSIKSKAQRRREILARLQIE